MWGRMATERGDCQGRSDDAGPRNFRRANEALCRLDLAGENLTQVELSRALIFLLGWPGAERDAVLRAARDNDFGLRRFEIPDEVIRAAREDMLGSPQPATPPPGHAGPAPGLPAMLPFAATDGDASTSSGSSSSSGGSYFGQTSSAAEAMTNLSHSLLLRPIRRRSPQICKKCLQPRKGHMCRPKLAQPVQFIQPAFLMPGQPLGPLPSREFVAATSVGVGVVDGGVHERGAADLPVDQIDAARFAYDRRPKRGHDPEDIALAGLGQLSSAVFSAESSSAADYRKRPRHY